MTCYRHNTGEPSVSAKKLILEYICKKFRFNYLPRVLGLNRGTSIL